MLDEAVFSSADLPAAERFSAWRELMAGLPAPMDLTSDYSADFHAHQRIIALGGAVVWPATFDPLTFRRSRRLIRQSDPENIHLSLVLQGSAGVMLERHEKTCRVFDFHTNDSSRPYEIKAHDLRIKMIGVEIPKTALPFSRLIDLVSALFAQALERPGFVSPESHKRTLVLRIKDFIRHNLHDPALNPGMVAAAHHISLSYLHRKEYRTSAS